MENDSINEPILYKKGDVIFAEGESAHYVYIVTSGKVKILVNANGKLLPVSTIKKNDFIGELSMFSDDKRSASAIASEDSMLVLLKKTELRTILKDCPEWVTNIMLTLTDRLRRTTIVLSEHGIKNVEENEYFLSEDEMAFYFKNIKDYKKRRGIKEV